MLKQRDWGPVRGFRLAASLWGISWYYTAAFLVDGLLVDSGCARTAAELRAALAAGPPHTVAVTHHHEDHVGANAALAEAFGARILAPQGALATLVAPWGSLPLKPYQRVIWGHPHPQAAEPLPASLETPQHCFEVIATPGHSPDHVCFYEPDKGWLFVGDAFVGGRDRSLRADYDIWGIIASLKKLAALPAERMFCGSGSVYQNPGPHLQEKVDYLEDLGGRVLELHSDGLSYRGIRRKLLGREGLIRYITLGNFSGFHLVRSYLENRPAGVG